MSRQKESFVSYANLDYEIKQAKFAGKDIAHVHLTNRSLQYMKDEPNITVGNEEQVATFDGITLYVAETNVIVFGDGTKRQL